MATVEFGLKTRITIRNSTNFGYQLFPAIYQFDWFGESQIRCAPGGRGDTRVLGDVGGGVGTFDSSSRISSSSSK